MDFIRHKKPYYERVDNYINHGFGTKCTYLRHLNHKPSGLCPDGCSKWECKKCYPRMGVLTNYSKNKIRLFKERANN